MTGPPPAARVGVTGLGLSVIEGPHQTIHRWHRRALLMPRIRVGHLDEACLPGGAADRHETVLRQEVWVGDDEYLGVWGFGANQSVKGEQI